MSTVVVNSALSNLSYGHGAEQQMQHFHEFWTRLGKAKVTDPLRVQNLAGFLATSTSHGPVIWYSSCKYFGRVSS